MSEGVTRLLSSLRIRPRDGNAAWWERRSPRSRQRISASSYFSFAFRTALWFGGWFVTRRDGDCVWRAASEDVEDRIGSRENCRREGGEHPGQHPSVGLPVDAAEAFGQAGHVGVCLHQVATRLAADGTWIVIGHGWMTVSTRPVTTS